MKIYLIGMGCGTSKGATAVALDALKNAECDEVLVELSGALSPMKVMPKEGDGFLFLVLPVRLKSE